LQDHLQLDQAELFRVMFDESSIAMAIQDEHLRLVVVNQAYCELMGYSEDEMLGRDPIEFALASDNHDAVRQHREMTSALGDRKPSRVEVYRELIHRDGRRIPVRLEVAWAQTLDNAKQLYTSVFDLSGQQQAIEAIEKRYDLIVLETHHRLKNNLQGLAGLIEHKVLTHPQLEKPLGDVAAWLGMVGDIHGLKFEQGGQVDLLSMLKAAVTGVSTLFDIDIPVTACGRTESSRYPVSEGSTLSLALIVNELLTNACKYSTNSSPSVSIGSHELGVQVTVSNPGSLPDGFNLNDQSLPDSGLGLVSGLIPSRGMSVSLDCADEIVTATLVLSEPVITGLSRGTVLKDHVPDGRI